MNGFQCFKKLKWETVMSLAKKEKEHEFHLGEHTKQWEEVVNQKDQKIDMLFIV